MTRVCVSRSFEGRWARAFARSTVGRGLYRYGLQLQEQEKGTQLRVGYKGMCKLARQTGGVTTIRAHEVCANDQVDVDFGFPKVLHIRPADLFADRGVATGYVAVIEFKDSSFDFDAMSVEDCHRIRDRSDAWRAFEEG